MAFLFRIKATKAITMQILISNSFLTIINALERKYFQGSLAFFIKLPVLLGKLNLLSKHFICSKICNHKFCQSLNFTTIQQHKLYSKNKLYFISIHKASIILGSVEIILLMVPPLIVASFSQMIHPNNMALYCNLVIQTQIT